MDGLANFFTAYLPRFGRSAFFSASMAQRRVWYRAVTIVRRRGWRSLINYLALALPIKYFLEISSSYINKISENLCPGTYTSNPDINNSKLYGVLNQL